MSQLNRTILFNKVIEVLKRNPYGLSSTDLSKMLKINRMTLVKYLSVMQARGLVEFKNIGMAKVWHTSTKLDLVNMITKQESSAIHKLLTGEKTSSRKELGDDVPLSVFRVMKASLGLSKEPVKAMYNAGIFVANTCLPNGGMTAQDICNSLHSIFRSLKIGILTNIQLNPKEWAFKLEESATAHKTEIKGSNLCHFEAGLISGFVSNNLKKQAIIRETKCIGTGSNYCEFIVSFDKKA